MRQLLVATIAVGVAISGVTLATIAHESDCDVRLREASVEELQPPPGWFWRDLEVGPEGWTGHAEWAGGDIRAATFRLTCPGDAGGLFERRQEVRAALHFEQIDLGLLDGENVAGWTAPLDGRPRIDWYSGDVFGSLVGEWNAGTHELVAIARLLESAYLAVPSDQ